MSRPARCRQAQPQPVRSQRLASSTVGVAVREDSLCRQATAGPLLPITYTRQQYLCIWPAGQLDQLRTHVLLERPADQCRPCGEFIAGLVWYVPDRDSGSHSSIMLLLAVSCKPGSRASSAVVVARSGWSTHRLPPLHGGHAGSVDTDQGPSSVADAEGKFRELITAHKELTCGYVDLGRRSRTLVRRRPHHRVRRVWRELRPGYPERYTSLRCSTAVTVTTRCSSSISCRTR